VQVFHAAILDPIARDPSYLFGWGRRSTPGTMFAVFQRLTLAADTARRTMTPRT